MRRHSGWQGQAGNFAVSFREKPGLVKRFQQGEEGREKVKDEEELYCPQGFWSSEVSKQPGRDWRIQSVAAEQKEKPLVTNKQFCQSKEERSRPVFCTVKPSKNEEILGYS